MSLERELGKRCGDDYRVVCKDSAEAGPLPAHAKFTIEFFAIASPASRVRRDTRDQLESGNT